MLDKKTNAIRLNISIEIPRDLDAETVISLQKLIGQIQQTVLNHNTGSKPQSSHFVGEDPEIIAAREQRYAESLRIYRLKRVQCYRLYRRIVCDFDKPYDAVRAVAVALDWEASLAAKLIAERRHEVGQYIRRRRLKISLKLAAQGWSNPAIAKHFGVAPRTVVRLLSEARSQTKGAAHA